VDDVLPGHKNVSIEPLDARGSLPLSGAVDHPAEKICSQDDSRDFQGMAPRAVDVDDGRIDSATKSSVASNPDAAATRTHRRGRRPRSLREKMGMAKSAPAATP